MTSKRTFGLVGDYGGDSSDDEDKNGSVPGPGGNEVVEKNSEHGYLVQKIPKLDTAANSNTTTSSSKEEALGVTRSKWDGVRTEYDDSSLMYKFTQDLADEETNTPSVQKKVDPKAADEAAKKALAAADDVLKSVSGDPAAISIPPEAEQSEYFKQLVEAEKRREKDKADREQAALDWEIREIQKDIEEERKRWDGVYSDEEGDGAETEAVFKDQRRRNDVIQAVLDEVTKTNKKAEEGDTNLEKYNKKGEGWKRLQMIAQSRVNTDPDKINQYPSHKFPLKD